MGETVGKNVRLGKAGLEKGEGAGVLYYKHLKENQRSGILGISNTSLLFGVIIVFMALLMKDAGILSIFGISAYMQLFSVSLGRFSRERSKAYIYLIPEPPINNMFHSDRLPRRKIPARQPVLILRYFFKLALEQFCIKPIFS